MKLNERQSDILRFMRANGRKHTMYNRWSVDADTLHSYAPQEELITLQNIGSITYYESTQNYQTSNYPQLFTEIENENDNTKELTNAQQKIINTIRKTLRPSAPADDKFFIAQETMMDYATYAEVADLRKAGAIDTYHSVFYILAPAIDVEIKPITKTQARTAYDLARQETFFAYDELSRAAKLSGTANFAKTLRRSADEYHTALEREARAARILINLL